MQKRTPRPDDVKLSATVSRDVWRRLRDVAEEQNRSLNDLLNEWIAEKLAAWTPAEDRKGGFYRPDPGVLAASRCVDG